MTAEKSNPSVDEAIWRLKRPGVLLTDLLRLWVPLTTAHQVSLTNRD